MDGCVRRSLRLLGGRKLRSHVSPSPPSPCLSSKKTKKTIGRQTRTKKRKKKRKGTASASTGIKNKKKKRKAEASVSTEIKKKKKRVARSGNGKETGGEHKKRSLAGKLAPRIETFLDTLGKQRFNGRKSFSRVLSKAKLKSELERWFSMRKKLRTQKKSPQTLVLHHGTRYEHLKSIGQHGLLIPMDRFKKNISAYTHGSCFGQGIYCGSSPFHFRGYGSHVLVGLAQLGNTSCVVTQDSFLHRKLLASETVVGNKGYSYRPYKPTDNGDEIVLRHSAQIVSVFNVRKDHVFDPNFKDKAGISRATLASVQLESLTAKFLEEEDPDWESEAAAYDVHRCVKLPSHSPSS